MRVGESFVVLPLLMVVVVTGRSSAQAAEAEGQHDKAADDEHGRTMSKTHNLVQNPSFEETGKDGSLPAGWKVSPNTSARDAATAHTGGASLKLTKTDRNTTSQPFATQGAPAKAGQPYEFSAWIKTESIRGFHASSANICMEWCGEGKRYLGGSYPGGLKGARGWTQVRAWARIPANAESATVSCFVPKQVTGTAWFDDVEVRRVIDPPMHTVVLSPSYRGLLNADGPQTIRVNVRLNNADRNLRFEKVQLTAELLPRGSARVLAGTDVRPRGNTASVTIPTAGLQPGDYVVRISLADQSGEKILATSEHSVRRPNGDFRPAVAIDGNQRLLVDGKPFFPLGMAWMGITEEDVKLYADSKFNCMMAYAPPKDKEGMDLLHRYGLKIIYSMLNLYAGMSFTPESIKTKADEERAVRNCVRKFRDHPALLAWYLNDELPPPYIPELEAHQRWVEGEDPNHPTWMALMASETVRRYFRAFDAIGTDPYPIPTEPASKAARWTRLTVAQVENARPVWMAVQACNIASYKVGEEEISHAYL